MIKSMLAMVYLSLGSNVGDREAHRETAQARLGGVRPSNRRGRLFYETEPVEFTEQLGF